MKKTYINIGILIIIALLFYGLCTTVVLQGQISVVMLFGKPVKVMTEPGIYLKLPYPLHRVDKIDGRLTILQPKPAELLTSDKKNLILENCVCYRITDPILFMKTVRDKKGLEVRLTDLLTSHTGLLLGVKELSDIVNVDTSKIHFRAINDELTELMRKDGEELGIEVEKVFIKRIMLPQQNKLAVYDRMRAERDRIAKKYIAEGEEKALEIRAEADKKSRTIIAEAEREAAIIRGEAEAEAMRIYGEAYSKNREFYRFLRALEAYEKMFNDKTVIILDESSPILKELFSGGKVER
ncbi:MAG: protease modulator HflC [candidate division Zixibacteria bacterium]|nr:protease modulator HflC [Candidatus Tariuqbacter arcticus]